MKKYTLLAAVILIATSAGVATAYFGDMGRMGGDGACLENQEKMIESRVEMLGLDLEEVRTKLSEGKTMREIISEAGITKEEMVENRKALMIEHINEFLADGKITQEEADKRLQWIEERPNKGGFLGRGMRRGF